MAAADVVHLMTELVDNALAFSPPTAPVKISTKQAGDSTIVEISDGGLGIAQDVLNSLNEDLRSGGEVTVETARRMGLLVVSRIATRHGITVSLARNARGGTTATVLIPPALLRGRQAPVQPKQRPGLAGLTPAKSVLPAAVTERLTNEAEPKKLPTRPEPVAPAAPAATAAASPSRPAAVAQAAPQAPAAAPPRRRAGGRHRLDLRRHQRRHQRLPQRSPGATRSGGAMPGAPVGSTGGSLFQRLQANGTRPTARNPAEPELPQREPATPTVAFDAIDEALAKTAAEVEAQQVRRPPRSRRPTPRPPRSRSRSAERGAAGRRSRAAEDAGPSDDWRRRRYVRRAAERGLRRRAVAPCRRGSRRELGRQRPRRHRPRRPPP